MLSELQTFICDTGFSRLSESYAEGLLNGGNGIEFRSAKLQKFRGSYLTRNISLLYIFTVPKEVISFQGNMPAPQTGAGLPLNGGTGAGLPLNGGLVKTQLRRGPDQGFCKFAGLPYSSPRLQPGGVKDVQIMPKALFVRGS